MLKIYAKAVASMKATAAKDPDSWTFQWYTHAVRNDKTKAGELLAIFGPGSSPNKMLAQSMWDTCQAHMPPNIEDDFLPWHRMFVYYFEEIIRAVSGKKHFTLPYWNYSVAGPNHGVIPPEFTKKNDPLLGSLYIDNRNPGVNMGQAIDKGFPPGTLGTDALAECFYEPSGGIDPGFCMKLDFGLHGTVHVLVGDGKNMGSVPWAANDPIFWLHHCNIDRLWASWNKAGRKNPPGSGSFTFAEKKQKVVANISDWMVPETEAHGYCYDHLEPVPKCPTTKEDLIARLQNQLRVAAVKAKDIKLGAGRTSVSLEPLSVKKGAKPKAFDERVRALPKNKHLSLLVKNLQADAPPGILYHLYLELPEGAKGDKLTPHFVGTINFFDAVRHADAHAKKDQKDPERFYQFDITNLARTLDAKKLLMASPTLTIAPAGTPAEKANPVIGEISIVEH
jgi:tyrosinase